MSRAQRKARRRTTRLFVPVDASQTEHVPNWLLFNRYFDPTSHSSRILSYRHWLAQCHSMMFAKGTRFVPAKASDVPGPNTYDVEETEFDAYKRGAFLENAGRFMKEKLVEAPKPTGRKTPDPSRDPKSSRPPTKSSSADRCAVLQRKLEDMERVHQETRKSHQAEVERLKHELNSAQKSKQERTERFEKLKKQSDLMESRVQELKKQYDKEHTELKELRTKVRAAEHEKTQLATKQEEVGEARKALQALESRRRDELKERDRKILDLEKANAAEKKKRELLEARLSEMKDKVDAQTQQALDRAGRLEQEVRDVTATASRASASLKTGQDRASEVERDLLMQLEQHRQMLSRVAEEYARLASSTVAKATHERVKLDLIASQLLVSRLDRKLASTEGQVQDLAQLVRQGRDDNQILREHLSDAESTTQIYSAALKSALGERNEAPSRDRALYEDFAFLRLDIVQEKLSVQRALSFDTSLWSSLYRQRHDSLLLHSSFLIKHLDNNDRNLHKQAELLSTAQTKATLLHKSVSTLQAERDTLQKQLSNSIANVAEANGRLDVLKKERQDAETRLKVELGKIEQSLTQEKEANRRLAGTVQRGKHAEEALQSEIEELTATLSEAESYQDAYNHLLEEVGALIQRNALAEEETQRLSRFNAEILGHNNPAQRVVYLDRIRRELHETKQQLLTMQRDRDAAVDVNEDLRHELQLYKVGRLPLGDQNVNAASVNVGHGGEDILQYLPEDGQYRDGDLTLEDIS
ncbi:hypothetical protein EIP91_003964 [Steccherinum ochraceum]|uniref:Uncharacterized protein n=1 Tax=Steccherinum ochraceum TaxID=92696 RepID=A0A4R0RUP5_9APHY|nr:hypothetical protein EIP91_003964 [Steccherinum ochraceum]